MHGLQECGHSGEPLTRKGRRVADMTPRPNYMFCSAATEPYTLCGLEEVVRISEVERVSLHHLPDVYLGRIGKTWSELEIHIDSLMAIALLSGFGTASASRLRKHWDADWITVSTRKAA